MRVARSLIVTVALLAVTASAVVGQDIAPLEPEPPELLPKARIGAFTNAFDDPAINESVNAATRNAAEEVDAAMKRLRNVTLPSARSVTQAAADLAEDQRLAIAVVVGGFQPFTLEFAERLAGQTVFLDIAQATPCVNADGRFDGSGTCSGGTSALPTNYMAISFAEEEAGYLAGVVAAAAARNGRLGIIAGIPGCAACNRYMQGFELGARWWDPDIEIITGFITDDDAGISFAEPDVAEAYATAFAEVHRPDVILAVARASNRAIYEAVCDLGVGIVGVDLDVSEVQPSVAECVVTSAVKPIGDAVREAIFDVANQELVRVKRYDIANQGVAITDEWMRIPGLPVDLPTRLRAATDEIVTGIAVTCPEHCGRPAPTTEVVDATA